MAPSLAGDTFPKQSYYPKNNVRQKSFLKPITASRSLELSLPARAFNEFKAKGFYRRAWNLLDLRHSYGTNFLAGGGRLRELQYLMGHENIFDTRRIYGAGSSQMPTG